MDKKVDNIDVDELILDVLCRKIEHLDKHICKLEDEKKHFMDCKHIYEDRLLKKKMLSFWM